MQLIWGVAYQRKHVREQFAESGISCADSPRSWSSDTTLFMSFLSFLYSIAFSLSSGGRLRSSWVYVFAKCMAKGQVINAHIHTPEAPSALTSVP